MEPGIQERVTAGGTHGKPMTEKLNEKEIVLVDEIDVNVPNDIENIDREPTYCKGCDHQHNESEYLPLAESIKLCLTLRGVARDHPVLQLDRNANIGQ